MITLKVFYRSGPTTVSFLIVFLKIMSDLCVLCRRIDQSPRQMQMYTSANSTRCAQLNLYKSAQIASFALPLEASSVTPHQCYAKG